jgi:hypothetical protein
VLLEDLQVWVAPQSVEHHFVQSSLPWVTEGKQEELGDLSEREEGAIRELCKGIILPKVEVKMLSDFTIWEGERCLEPESERWLVTLSSGIVGWKRIVAGISSIILRVNCNTKLIHADLHTLTAILFGLLRCTKSVGLTITLNRNGSGDIIHDFYVYFLHTLLGAGLLVRVKEWGLALAGASVHWIGRCFIVAHVTVEQLIFRAFLAMLRNVLHHHARLLVFTNLHENGGVRGGGWVVD